MDSQDFSKYSKGMDRMARFFTWPGVILLLVVPAAWAGWAYYNHLVLVLMLFALAFVGGVEGVLLDGLIITRQDDVESLRREAEALSNNVTSRRDDLREGAKEYDKRYLQRGELDGRVATVETAEDLRGQLAHLSQIVSDSGLEEFARSVRVWSREIVETESDVDSSVFYNGGLDHSISYLRSLAHGLSDAEYRLRDALVRIDRQALRRLEDVREDREWRLSRDHDPTDAEPQPPGYEPSIARLEGEIAKLRQEIEALRGSHSA